MRRRVWLGLALSLLVTSVPANSQDVSQPAAEACEVHFWPASAVDTYPKPAQAQGGLVWALALGGKKRAEALQAVRSEIASNLDADGSLNVLGRSDLANRLGLRSATVIVHQEPLDKSGLNRIRNRRATSKSPCYSELIVTSILYKNGSFGGQFLDSGFMLREFGSENMASRVTTGGGSIRLNNYPASEGEDTEAAYSDLNSAFRQGFKAFVAKLTLGR